MGRLRAWNGLFAQQDSREAGWQLSYSNQVASRLAAALGQLAHFDLAHESATGKKQYVLLPCSAPQEIGDLAAVC